jgi:hypothetical protein
MLVMMEMGHLSLYLGVSFALMANLASLIVRYLE